MLEGRVGSKQVPIVGDAIGGSIAYDEYKGDFVAARRLADEAWARAAQAATPEPRTDALLARGVVQFLSGEAAGAIESFDELMRTVPGDTLRVARAGSYRYAAQMLRANTQPEGGSSESVELQARWDLIADAEAETRRTTNIEALFSGADGAMLALEFRLLNLLSMMPVPRGIRSATLERDRQLARAFAPMMAQFRATCEELNAPPGVLAYADRLSAEMLWKAGAYDDSQAHLERAAQGYVAARDDAGHAACLSAHADWLIAPSSNPATWNRFLRPGMPNSDLGWLWEDREFVPPNAEHIATATDLYAEADKLFERAAARRGLGAVALRRGYIAAAQEQYEPAAALAGDARLAFAATATCSACTRPASTKFCAASDSAVPLMTRK